MPALPRLLSRHALFLVLAAAACAAPAFGQDGAAPPVEAFFSKRQLTEVTLSPSGRYLAAISGEPGRRDRLVVIDLDDNKARMVAGDGDLDVVEFEWVNDKRLLFKASDRQGVYAGWYPRDLYAVDRDGSGLRKLSGQPNMEASQITDRLLSSGVMLGQRGAQNSDEAFVTQVEYLGRDRPPTTELLRLNTVTGKTRKVAPPPGVVDRWLLDNAGEPRLTVSTADGKTRIHYLDPGTGNWRLLTEFAQRPGSREVMTPVGFGPDGTLYVRSYAGKDTAALYTVDPGTGKLGANPVVVMPGYDFDGSLLGRPGKLLGVQVETDASAAIWFDKDMQAVQQAVDKLLSGTVNLIEVAARADAPWNRVLSFSDTVPTFYSVFDPRSGKLVAVGKSREGIDPSRMGRSEPIRYKARDGREIPALLTLPAGTAKKNLPLVLLVHDGPYVRGSHWQWDPETQFLASRGYAVLEPDYRGSTGYGLAHYLAGWKQWGLAMQDDLADGVRWAIAQGIADPKRICIAGTGYGGYAALMGLAKDPELFRCGIARSGYTDLGLFDALGATFISRGTEHYEGYGWSELVGDPAKDAAQLKAASPLHQAGRIAQPVLLAYGAEDTVIPLYDAKLFRDALLQTNRRVEWVEYPEEGHRWARDETIFDYWRRVERFLGRHLGQGAALP